MSRRKTQEEQDSEALAADQASAKRFQEQRDCAHWRAVPSEWYWSGQIRMMACPECGAENYLEEAEGCR